MMHNKTTCLIVCLFLAGVTTACTRYHGPRYGERTISYTVPGTNTKPPVAKPCSMTGQIVAETDPACVGKVFSSGPGGPTITVLKPGVAVPLADVDAAILPPPSR